MIEKKVDNGLVCVFDILGYKNIIENNSIDECAIIIKDILIKLPQEIVFEYLSMLPNISAMNELLNILNKHCNYIMVSDTIIMFFDYENLGKNEKSKYIMLSILYIIKFQYLSFKSGLPMRSCIDFGSFYFYENIFAGKSIINCFNESEKLNFSGITITEKAGEFIINNIDELTQKYFGMCIFKYNTPLKNGFEEEKYLIDWYTTSHDAPVTRNLKQKIVKSFSMHNKTIDKSVQVKIENTEKIIKYCLYGKGK